MKRPNKKQTEPNKVGRPVKWTEAKAMELAEELIQWLLISEKNIWFERFLYEEKGLYHQLISDLCSKYEKFSDTIKRAKKIQEFKMVDISMKNGLNPTMTIFVLKNNFGYKDKTQQDIDHTTNGNDINPPTININIKKNE